MEANEIEHYLAELGEELQKRGITQPVRILIIGGAYMCIAAHAPRATQDIDIFWLEEEGLQKVFNPLRESVQIIMERHLLNANWFNYVTQLLMYDEIIVPDGELWKYFGPLHIYIPTHEYILALKIVAGREKDLEDCAILLPRTAIKTREQAQQLLDQYILPEGQQKNASNIESSFRWLFERT
jgi:hypothetical protein